MRNQIMKRITALFIAVISILSVFPAQAFAATGDIGTAALYKTYDSDGNSIKYNSSAVINGLTAGGAGSSKYRIYVDGAAAFCIEPGAPLSTGNTLTESASSIWNALSSSQKKAVGLALLYGYQGNKSNLSGNDDEISNATQILVWEFVTGCRQSTGSYSQVDTTVYSLLFGSNYANTGTKTAYNQIVALLQKHNTIPSFMSSSQTGITKDLSYNDGKYSITLTDSNGVLSDYTFTCSDSNVSITKSGNNVTISSTSVLSGTARITATRSNVPTVSSSSKLVAYGSTTVQDVIIGAENADSVVAYINIDTPTGEMALKKVSEDGIVEGIEFSITGENYQKTVKTGSDGTISIKDIIPGKYTITEVSTPERYISPKSQTITIAAGKTSSVTFENVLKRGSLKITKTSEDGLVEGMTFHLYGTSLSGASVNLYAVTDASGVATFEDVLISNSNGYTVEEVDTPIRYVIPDSQTAVINWNEVTNKSFDNILKKFRVSLTKTDIETGSAQADATLAGAVYGIYKGAQLVDTYTTDANGQFTTDYYICDTDWTIREISSSEGYLLDSTIHKVGADPGDFTVEFNTVYNDVTEQVIKGKIAIIKHSDDGSTQIETPEEGAEFEVYLKSARSYGDAKDTERDVLTCDENGFAQTKDLPYGVYTVHQTKGWDGTEFMSDFDVFISKDGQTYRFLINNAPYFSYVKITKVDAETGKPVTSSSAAYQIYDSNGELVTMTYTYPTPTTIDTFYTDSEGYLITPEKLPYGEYTLVEVQAPYGYVLNNEPIAFTVSQENSTTDDQSGIEVISVTQNNIAQKGTVTITKVGDTFNSVTENEDGTYSPSYYEKAMEGVVFDIIAVEDIYTGDGTLRASEGDVVDTITTAADGTAICKQLYLGKYIIRETETLEGYVLNTNDFAFELTYAGQEIQLVEVYKTIENELQKVEISLEKLMEQDETFGIGANSEYSSVRFGLYSTEDITAIDGSVIPAEGLIEVISIDENGYGVFKTDLPFGEYYVQEIATDNHYLMSDTKYPVSFSYTGADVPVIQVKINDGEPIVNELIRGSVNGIKVDEDGEGLAGALIGLFKADETEFTTEYAYMTAESAEDGSFSFENVPYGDWVIREIESPTGYVLNNESYDVTITEDEQVVEVEIENTQIRGGFILYKVDADDNNILLDGAVFELYSGDDELLDEFTVNDGQYSQSDLVYGSYYLLEKEAPDNYELSEEKYPFEITEDGAIIEIIALNEKSLGGVHLVKTDSDDDSLTLKCTEFMLYNSENTLIGTYETNENGIINVDGLTYGDYYFIESVAPAGYDLDDMPIHFTINEKTTEGYTHYVELSVTNSETPEYVGGVRLTKIDADDKSMKLEGALFGLYNSNDELIDEYTTDSDGIIEVSNLPYDDYYFVEIIAPEGYELDVTPIKFTIDADTTKDGTELVQVAATNVATPELLGGVRLTKIDADDDSVKLAGAVFELHNSDDKLIDEYTTDSDGVIEVNDLPYGDYYFVEITAPEGYELDSTPIKFTIDADTTKDGTELVEIAATNEATPDTPEDTDTTSTTTTTTTTDDGKGDSPKTGDDTNLILPIIILAGGALGAGFALWKRKKGKEKK